MAGHRANVLTQSQDPGRLFGEDIRHLLYCLYCGQGLRSGALELRGRCKPHPQ